VPEPEPEDAPPRAAPTQAAVAAAPEPPEPPPPPPPVLTAAKSSPPRLAMPRPPRPKLSLEKPRPPSLGLAPSATPERRPPPSLGLGLGLGLGLDLGLDLGPSATPERRPPPSLATPRRVPLVRGSSAPSLSPTNAVAHAAAPSTSRGARRARKKDAAFEAATLVNQSMASPGPVSPAAVDATPASARRRYAGSGCPDRDWGASSPTPPEVLAKYEAALAAQLETAAPRLEKHYDELCERPPPVALTLTPVPKSKLRLLRKTQSDFGPDSPGGA